MKHRSGRDVPARRGDNAHQRPLSHGRTRKADGTSFQGRSAAAGETPKRPIFCMLFDDFAADLEPAPVLGMFPQAFVRKVLPWLKCKRGELLHICSGALRRGEGIRVDIRPAARPDIVADGRALPFADGSIAAALIDPPYSEHYARELYGTDYPRPAHLLAEAARVVRAGGRIGFVHYIIPNAPPGCIYLKSWALSLGFGYPVRALSIYEREQARLL